MLVIKVTTFTVINMTNNLKNDNTEKLTLWLYAKKGLRFSTIVAIRNSKTLIRLEVFIMVSISVVLWVLYCVTFDH
jgi:hypothetical protein